MTLKKVVVKTALLAVLLEIPTPCASTRKNDILLSKRKGSKRQSILPISGGCWAGV